MPTVAAGTGLVLGLGGAFGWHLVQNATMDSSLAAERDERITAVAAANKEFAAAAQAFGEAAPDIVVLDYLRALAAGEVDTEAESALVPDDVSTALLTTEAYSMVSGRVTGPTITAVAVNESKGEATVTAAYYVGPDNTPVTDTFELHADGDDWVLDTSLVSVVSITTDRSGSVTIGGVDVTADLTDDGTTVSGQVALLPGHYDAAFSEPTGFWGVDSATSIVVGTDIASPALSLSTTVSPAVLNEVQAYAQNQINAWNDECAASRFTGASCSPTVQAVGAAAVGRVVYRFYTTNPPLVSVTWNEGTNTFTYRSLGWLAADGEAADGSGILTIDTVNGHSGTATWNGPGLIDMPIGFT